MFSLFLEVFLVIFAITYILICIAFLFWITYIFQIILQKMRAYRTATNTQSTATASQDQTMQAYNAKTEIIKNGFLLAMNTLEWSGLTLVLLASVHSHLKAENNCHNQANGTNSDTSAFNCFIANVQINRLYHGWSETAATVGHNCYILSLALIISLMHFLTARYAQKSWIKTNGIPHFIVATVLLIVLVQGMSLFCSLILISKCIQSFIEAIFIILGVKVFRRLSMVIDWSIVDLRTSRSNPELLKINQKSKTKFAKYFSTFWLGVTSLFLGKILMNAVLILGIVLSNLNCPKHEVSLCKIHVKIIPKRINFILVLTSNVLISAGMLLILVPYTIYGLWLMSVLFWRKMRGKSGFKTHFHNSLQERLLE